MTDDVKRRKSIQPPRLTRRSVPLLPDRIQGFLDDLGFEARGTSGRLADGVRI